MLIRNTQLDRFINFKAYKVVLYILVMCFTFNVAFAKSAPDSFADLAEKLSPSVVNISTTTIIKERSQQMPSFPPGSPFEEFFKQYEKPNQKNRKAQSLGSGFIIDKTGYVITNNHVIENAEKIMVILYDDKSFEATVVGRDPKTDVALLKIDPKKTILSEVKFSDSDKLRVGDWVMAIGNPFGFGGSVTAGIVSARGRNLSGSYDDYIQTDASINKGNSGGPLFDMNGNVVGINTAIFSQSGGSVGIGFAISSNLAKQVTDQLKAYGRTKRGWLGVLIQEISKEIADSLEMKSAKGALVSSATEGGPAFKAGVKTGDVIIKFNDIVIDNMKELPKVVASTPVGKSVPLVIWRNGKTITLNVVLGELELAEKDNLILSNDNVDDKKSKSFDKLGFVGEELNAENKMKYNIKDIKTGLLISDVKPDSTADKAGLKSGMVIVRVGQIEVQSLKIMDEAIQNAVKQKRKAILLLVKIEKGTRFVALELN
ncbi:DegQ family serine endoprotease [Alphaproteobacteria bacterium]|jgi:serine protease Do|nr:DegQ family serine endoprotease [Alphaproteobacteria bacterium]